MEQIQATGTSAYQYANQAHAQVQAVADISRSCYVVIATQPVHQLQIRPMVHN